jgi:trk system potassium uptake protein TrkH
MKWILEIFSSFSVARSVVGGFFLLILLGSFCIYLSEDSALSYIDSFYLSASAVCVTGLSPVPISELDFSTQLIILILVQLGGLGIITFTVMIGILILQGLSRNTKFHQFIKDAIDSTDEDEAKDTDSSSKEKEQPTVLRVLFSIINISITIEAIGTYLIYQSFPQNLPENVNRIFLSVFTSVSAFNNAGFSILDDLSIIAYDPTSLYIVSVLIVLGGIGFPVIIYVEKIILQALHRVMFYIEANLETYYVRKIMDHPEREELPRFYPFIIKLSHSLDENITEYDSHLLGSSNKIQWKILFYGTLTLLTVGTLFIIFQESSNPHTLYGMNTSVKWANAFFISVCSRTAGFNAIDLTGVNDPTIVMIILLMFIGGGPQGTAGGVKITTFVILMAYLKNVINPTKTVRLFGEIVSKNSIAISIRVYFLATMIIAIVFSMLTLLNQNQHILHVVFFELISAFSTVGFSLGLTSTLGDVEKLFYCLIMFVGRIGIFTILIAVTGHSGVPKMGDDDGVKIQVG